MIEEFIHLQRMRTKQKDQMGMHRTDRDELDNLRRRQEAQRTEVERMREREVFQEKLNRLNKVKLVPEFLDSRTASEETKSNHRRLERELARLRAANEPALRKADAKRAYLRQVKALKQEKDVAVRRAGKSCDDLEADVRKLRTKVDDYAAKMEGDKNQVRKKQNDKLALQQAIARLEHRKSQPPPEYDARAMNQEVADRRKEISDLDEEKNDVRRSPERA